MKLAIASPFSIRKDLVGVIQLVLVRTMHAGFVSVSVRRPLRLNGSPAPPPTTMEVDLGDETRLFGRLSGPASPCRHCKCRQSSKSSISEESEDFSPKSWSKGDRCVAQQPLLQVRGLGVGSMIFSFFADVENDRPVEFAPPKKNNKVRGGGGKYSNAYTKNGELEILGGNFLKLLRNQILGGGFKCFLFSPLLEEMIQFH